MIGLLFVGGVVYAGAFDGFVVETEASSCCGGGTDVSFFSSRTAAVRHAHVVTSAVQVVVVAAVVLIIVPHFAVSVVVFHFARMLSQKVVQLKTVFARLPIEMMITKVASAFFTRVGSTYVIPSRYDDC